MRDNPERFIESNTENSWLRYLNNMCIQGTWADSLIIQAGADALKVTIQIVETMPGHIREFNWRNNNTEATLRVFCL